MQELVWKTDQDKVNWSELSELYRIAPLGDKPAQALETVYSNSRFKCFVYLQDRLVGAGRALADGVDCSYICDVVVHPDCQGQKIGKAIIERLVAASQGHKKIILYANPGKEGFYRKLGFYPMNTAMAIFADQDRALRTGLIRDT